MALTAWSAGCAAATGMRPSQLTPAAAPGICEHAASVAALCFAAYPSLLVDHSLQSRPVNPSEQPTAAVRAKASARVIGQESRTRGGWRLQGLHLRSRRRRWVSAAAAAGTAAAAAAGAAPARSDPSLSQLINLQAHIVECMLGRLGPRFARAWQSISGPTPRAAAAVLLVAVGGAALLHRQASCGGGDGELHFV